MRVNYKSLYNICNQYNMNQEGPRASVNAQNLVMKKKKAYKRLQQSINANNNNRYYGVIYNDVINQTISSILGSYYYSHPNMSS